MEGWKAQSLDHKIQIVGFLKPSIALRSLKLVLTKNGVGDGDDGGG